MKASLKLREEDLRHHHPDPNPNPNPNPIVRAKIPISILGFPFISSIIAGDHKDLSFNLRTNFFNGPSLNLSYSPNTTTNPNNPCSLTLKSGVGLFGSPNNSPLIMSAHFNLFSSNPNPTFSLQIKPQFGDFFLKKTAMSTSLPNPNHNFPKQNGGSHFQGDAGIMPERPLMALKEFHEGKYGFLSGVAVMAKTVFPVTKWAFVKFRWGVNFPEDFGEKKKFPFLTVDKISIERIEEKAVVVKPLKSSGGDVGDLELLKGMCSWMRREVEVLQRENRGIKESLEDLRLVNSMKTHRESDNVGRKPVSVSTENSSEFERRRNKRNDGEEKGRKEVKKSGGYESPASDVGEELKRAIEAASSNGSNLAVKQVAETIDSGTKD